MHPDLTALRQEDLTDPDTRAELLAGGLADVYPDSVTDIEVEALTDTDDAAEYRIEYQHTAPEHRDIGSVFVNTVAATVSAAGLLGSDEIPDRVDVVAHDPEAGEPPTRYPIMKRTATRGLTLHDEYDQDVVDDILFELEERGENFPNLIEEG